MAVAVALAHHNLLCREGVAHVLSHPRTGVELVAVCRDLDSLMEAVESKRPDVVVTDIPNPAVADPDERIRLTATLRQGHPRTGVVILSDYTDPAYALALLDSGAERLAYLLNERVHDRSQLLSAVNTVAVGGSLIDPRIVEPLLLSRSQGPASPLEELTARELEVLAKIAQGASNAGIADSLVLTKRAVEKHINSIFLKLGLRVNENVSRRVKATLMFLADVQPSPSDQSRAAAARLPGPDPPRRT